MTLPVTLRPKVQADEPRRPFYCFVPFSSPALAAGALLSRSLRASSYAIACARLAKSWMTASSCVL